MMGAYAYCHKCSAPLSVPTIRQALTDNWECKMCDAHQSLDAHDKQFALDDLESRIVRLEEAVLSSSPSLVETVAAALEKRGKLADAGLIRAALLPEKD